MGQPASSQSVFLLVCLSILIILVYQPGLSGRFYVLDSINVVSENQQLVISSWNASEIKEAAYSAKTGPLWRPISMLTFAIERSIWGPNPARQQRKMNLGLHIFCGWIVFCFTCLLLKFFTLSKQYHTTNTASWNTKEIYWFSAIVAGIWLSHPLQTTTVLYIVQRMTILSCAFTLLAGCLYLIGRIRQHSGRRGWHFQTLGLCFFFPLGLLSKENVAVFPLMLFAIEFILGRNIKTSDSTRNWLRFLFSCFLVVPGIVVIALTAFHPGWILDDYALREFSLSERMMTEGRILLEYLSLIIWPDITRMGVMADWQSLSTSIFSPPTTALAGLFWVCVAGLSIRIRNRQPIIAFGLIFFIVGHILESSVFALELRFDHRNYLPSIGIYLIIVVGLHQTLKPMASSSIIKMALCLIPISLTISTYSAASAWSSQIGYAQIEAKRFPHSYRANHGLAEIYRVLANQEQSDTNKQTWLRKHAEIHFRKAIENKPASAVASLSLLQLLCDTQGHVESSEIERAKIRILNSIQHASTPGTFSEFLQTPIYRNCLGNAEIMKLIDASLEAKAAYPWVQASIALLKASMLADEGKISEAFSILNEALAKEPNSPIVLVEKSRLLLAIGEYDLAYEIFANIDSDLIPTAFQPSFHSLELAISSSKSPTLKPSIQPNK